MSNPANSNNRTRIWVSIIGTVGAITVAFFTGRGTSSNTYLSAQFNGQTVTLNTSGASLLQSSVSALQSENTALKASLSGAATAVASVFTPSALAPSTVTATTTVTPTVVGTTVTVLNPVATTPDEVLPAGVKIRHRGRIVFSKGQSVNLDSTDVSWITRGQPFDLTFDEGGSFNYNQTSDTKLDVNDLIPTYAYCQGATGYDAGHSFDLTPGHWVCYRTSGGRFAVIQVISQDSVHVVLDVTVYEPKSL